MSCTDKHVIAWKSFEIGDGILCTEDDVRKISLGLIIHESFIFAIKRRRNNVKKKSRKCK
jgi:hypothetical protein